MMFALLSLLLSLHPIHVSIAEIDHNADAKALQITLRIFIDDLELSIRNKTNSPEMDLLNPGGSTSTDRLVSDYLSNALKLKVDKKAVQTNYLGHEIEGPAMICYIEVPNVKKFKSIEVTNMAILETHEDQSNLVNVNYKEKVKSMRLTNEKPTGVVTFEEK
jgi:hypothetical protein